MPPNHQSHKAPSRAQRESKSKNGTLVLVIVGVVVSISMFLAVSVVFSGEVNIRDEPEKDEDEGGERQLPRRSSPCYALACNVTCSGISDPRGPGPVFSEYVNSSLYQDSCLSREGIGLILQDSIFPENAISEDWLAVSLNITELQILRCSLTTIRPGAFNGKSFTELRVLTLVGNQIVTLHEGTFEGLSSLKRFSLRDNKDIQSIETNVLRPIANTLESLQIQNLLTNSQFINNLTGSVSLPSLIEVDFRFNLVTDLKSNPFAGLINVKIIYLTGCQLSTIEADVFDVTASHLIQLHLEDNNLTTLPENVFTPFLNETNPVKVILSNNPLRCDCPFSWFQELVRNHGNIGVGSICGSPEWNKDKPVIDADFCFKTTPSPTEESTTIITTFDPPTVTQQPSTTTKPPPPTTEPPPLTTTTTTPLPPPTTTTPTTTTPAVLQITCLNSSSESRSQSVNVTHNIVESTRTIHLLQGESSVTVPLGDRGFTIENVEDNSVKIKVTTGNAEGVLFWYSPEMNPASVSKVTDAGCITSVRSTVNVPNLKATTAYNVCLLEGLNTPQYLSRCASFRTLPVPDDRAWLTYGSKPTILVGAGLVFGVLLAFALVGTFFVLHKFCAVQSPRSSKQSSTQGSPTRRCAVGASTLRFSANFRNYDVTNV